MLSNSAGPKRLARNLAGLMSACGIAVTLAAGPAAANSCIEEVEDLAARYGLATDLPDADLRDTPTVDDTKEPPRSGGVIEPPVAPNDPAVITPPAMVAPAMPTLPDATPAPDDGQGVEGLSAADLSILQSILIAARAEAERGEADRCFNHLSRANGYIEDQQAANRGG